MKIIRLPAQMNLPFQFKELLRIVICGALALQLSFTPFLAATSATNSAATKAASATSPADPILKVMHGELSRASASLAKTEPAPYFLSYTVNDQSIVVLVGAYGSLLTDAALERREADVVMRVGSPALDNTHGQSRASGMSSGTLPLGDDPDAISRVLWELTDREYKRAAPAFLNVKTNTAVRAEEEDKSPDFSNEAPQKHAGEALKPQAFDRTAVRSKACGLRASPACFCGASLEKSGDLSSSSARTAVLVLTLRYAGAARLYSRSVSSQRTREMASGSSPSGSVPEVMPLERLWPCVLSRAAEPTRITTSAWRRWMAASVSKLP